MAIFYEEGKGTEKDLTKAFEWYQKSAINGHPDAQYRLAYCYKYAKGTEKNLTEAFKWYKEAAQQEYTDAQLSLGYSYNNGIGTEQNSAKAFEWYTKAAEKGNVTAQYNLAICYKKGTGTEKNLTKAFEWYKKSADQGDSDAQYQVALCYKNGNGTEMDPVQALEYFEKSADRGNEKSYEKLAEMYFNGIEPIKKDLSKAQQWCTKAGLEKPWAKELFDAITVEIEKEEKLKIAQKATSLQKFLESRLSDETPDFSLPSDEENETIFHTFTNDELYRFALMKEKNGELSHAIFLLGVLASFGYRKALYTLSNMSQLHTEYFMYIEDYSEEEGNEQ